MPKLAKRGDTIEATDSHVVLVPSAGNPVPTPTDFTFDGPLDTDLSTTVLADALPAATLGARAHNAAPHVATTGTFQHPPTNVGTAVSGSATVYIDGRKALRDGDRASTCNDPSDAEVGRVVVASGTVLVDE